MTEKSKDFFPNKAGDYGDTDEILTAELKAAGIMPIFEQFNWDTRDNEHPFKLTLETWRNHFLAKGILEQSGEVKTAIEGYLYGWKFKRLWYYWSASGPGIPPEAAMKLHETHGRLVRVAGHCGCPSPIEWHRGLAVGHYHIDAPSGLRALADLIRSIVEPNTPEAERVPTFD